MVVTMGLNKPVFFQIQADFLSGLLSGLPVLSLAALGFTERSLLHFGGLRIDQVAPGDERRGELILLLLALPAMVEPISSHAVASVLRDHVTCYRCLFGQRYTR
jgi:hypothetical protein